MATQGGLESVENQGRSRQEGSKTLGENLTWGMLKDELITFIPPVQFGQVLDAKQWWPEAVPNQLKTRGDLDRKGKKHLVKI